MPAVLAPITAESEINLRKLWTRSECAALSETPGIEMSKLELVEGDLIRKMGKKRPHINRLKRLVTWMNNAFGEDFINSESPIDVAPGDNPINEPEPDLIVLNRPSWDFENGNPGPSDLRMVVEISDSTLAFDLRTKARLYARAGIPEYWVLDVNSRRLIVHRNPQPGGEFSSVLTYRESEIVPVEPNMSLRVADLF